jgi:hypothetical protein
MKYTIILAIFLILIFGFSIYQIGYNNGFNQHCNKDLFKYQCDNSPTLDYEFNCASKFTNISGIYCVENGTYVIKCANELK